MMPTADLTYHWQPKPKPEVLIQSWEVVASQIETSLFLTVDWLTAWLNSYGKPDWMLSVSNKGEIVAIAFFCERKHKRPLGMHVRTLHLNHAGCQAQDQIWPEYNHLMCLPQYSEQINRELINNAFEQHREITEFDTGLASKNFIETLDWSGFIAEQTLSVSSFIYDQAISDYSNLFSKNLRSEITRSERGLAKKGAFEVQIIESPERVWQQFKLMGPLHQQAWGDSSGFNNPEFMKFHSSLIQQKNTRIKPIIVNLCLKDEPSGLHCRHYLLLNDNTAYFYLGVTDKSLGARVKAGTYLHAKTIELLGQLGCTQYDFLGGDYRYKRRMSNKVIEMAQYRIKRDHAKFKLEQVLKKAKAKLTGGRL